MTVKIKYMGRAPTRKHLTDAGFDLAADEDVTIAPGERAMVGTGLRVAIPEGYEIQIRSRSGNAARSGLMVLNSPGTIDPQFRGEIGVILYNTGKTPFVIQRGARIAQAVVNKLPKVEWEESDSLDETDRGEKGFGSTGLSTEERPCRVEDLVALGWARKGYQGARDGGSFEATLAKRGKTVTLRSGGKFTGRRFEASFSYIDDERVTVTETKMLDGTVQTKLNWSGA